MRAIAKQSPLFWVLVILSLMTLVIGVWQWGERRQMIAEHSRPGSVPAARRAPDFALRATDGSEVSLETLRGKVVLLNFWATWCPPCKAEMPDLNVLHRDYGPAHDFAVVGVNLEESPEQVEAFARDFRISFPLLLDSKGEVTGERFAVRTLPTSIIIDRDGYIRDSWIGQIPREAVLARLERIW